MDVRDARALIGASAASQVGDWLYNAALLGYVYNATGSAGWVGAATICRLLPFVLLGPFGGLLADRYDRRTVLLVGDLARAGLMVALAAIVMADGPVLAVIALTAAASAAGTAERPAAMALLPRLVGETRLGAANALLHTVQDLGIVVGPALGALLLLIGPPEGAFLANAGTFAASAFLISTMQRRPSPARHRVDEGALAQLAHGVRTAWSTAFVVPLFIVVAMVELTYGAQTVQLVLYAEDRLDLGAGGYGYLLAAAGVGGVLSGVFNHRLASSTKLSTTVVGMGSLFCATQLFYAGTDSLALALAVTLVGGIGVVSCEVVAETALARVVPSEVLGRVMGVYDALSVAAMVLGALLAPVLIEATTLRMSLLVLGGGSVLLSVACLGAVRGLDALSEQRAAALSTQVAVIERLPIATGLSRAVLEQLASSSQMCPLPPGVDVVVEGAPAHAFYAVVSGSVVVHRGGDEVARLGVGDHFGERGLLDQAPRNASVTTAEETMVLRLEGDVLLEALQAAPTLLSALERSGGPASPDVVPTALVDDATWVPA